jgi:hypothetical protein
MILKLNLPQVLEGARYSSPTMLAFRITSQHRALEVAVVESTLVVVDTILVMTRAGTFT